MRQFPLVSVIIPCYNRTTLLKETIASIREQRYPHIELILVDDCSSESIKGAVQSVQWTRKPSIQIISSKIHMGPGAARELGRQAAQGDYLCYIDSDDLLAPEYITKQIAMLSRSEAGMCYCATATFAAMPLTGSEAYYGRSNKYYPTFLPTIFKGRPWGTGSCFWTRKATDSIGAWINTSVWEDYAYESTAGSLDIPIAYVPDVLCYIRRDLRGWLPKDQLNAAVQQAFSMFYIQDILSKRGKLSDGRTAPVLAWRFYALALELLNLGIPKLARGCLNSVQQLTYPVSLLHASAIIVNSVQHRSNQAAYWIGMALKRHAPRELYRDDAVQESGQ
jgi:glycosyltransferase involved in cell wall biosynthesis